MIEGINVKEIQTFITEELLSCQDLEAVEKLVSTKSSMFLSHVLLYLIALCINQTRES